VTVNVGVIAGGLRANVVAPEARAELDIRVLAAADAERIEREVLALTAETPGTRIEVEGGSTGHRWSRLPATSPCSRRRGGGRRSSGSPSAKGTAGGASDGSLTSRITPTLDGLGTVGDGAHATTSTWCSTGFPSGPHCWHCCC